MDWIKCITNWLRYAARREAGVTLVETVFAIAIFGVVATSLVGVLTSATAADSHARQRSIALELAQQQVEYVRQLNYMDVGISGGNPGGVVQATQSKWVAGLRYVLTNRIQLVTDPVPGSIVESANYKHVRVVVTRSSDNMVLASVSTYLSDSARLSSGSLNNGVLNVTVQDFNTGDLLEDAQVKLTKTWDLGFSAEDVTGNVVGSPRFGVAVFEGLEETPTTPAVGYYDVTVTKSGYATLNTDLPPSQIAIARSSTANEIINLYKPCTITVNVTDAVSGAAYTTNPVTVTITRNELSGEFTTDPATGSVTTSTLGGNPVFPGDGYRISVDDPLTHRHGESATNLTVAPNYPLELSSTFTVPLEEPVPDPATVTVTVRRSSCSTGDRVNGATVKLLWLPNPSDPAHYFQGTTNSQGRVVITGVPLETYDIYASKLEWTGGHWGHWDTLEGTLPAQTITGDSSYCVSIS